MIPVKMTRGSWQIDSTGQLKSRSYGCRLLILIIDAMHGSWGASDLSVRPEFSHAVIVTFIGVNYIGYRKSGITGKRTVWYLALQT